MMPIEMLEENFVEYVEIFDVRRGVLVDDFQELPEEIYPVLDALEEQGWMVYYASEDD